MKKLTGILFALCLLFAYGCTEQAKKESPASTAPAMEQGQDQHVSGDETSMESSISASESSSEDHVSGTSSTSDSESHMSGN